MEVKYIAAIFLNNLVKQAKKLKAKPITGQVFLDSSMLKQKKIGWYGWVDLDNGKAVATSMSIDLDNINDINLIFEIPKRIQANLNLWIEGKINV